MLPFSRLIRRSLLRLLSSEPSVVLEHGVPAIGPHLQGLAEIGLYLHIPFCRQICPYCPYNKALYEPSLAKRYARAVVQEIDRYKDLVGRVPVTSFYIGGGTPTTMLRTGLDPILRHIFTSFNMQCDIHMESHPNDLSAENLRTIAAMGVRHLSVGVEALQDRHLHALHRPYTTEQVKALVGRAVNQGFRCVNADAIFALPEQTLDEVEALGAGLLALGVDQVAAYPLFEFPYTAWHGLARRNGYKHFNVFRKRRMLRILEGMFHGAGFRRTSVWAFTRRGIPRYCSVTVPLYIGLGASGGTYLNDIFYVNTFHVPAYIDALEQGQLPIALSIELSEAMQMAGWLYWRMYETKFRKSDFEKRFGKPFDPVYGKYMRLLSLTGLVTNGEDEVACTDDGAFWLHWGQDLFSIDYVARLWGTSIQEPWPDRVVLEA